LVPLAASNAATPSHRWVAADDGATVPETETMTSWPPVTAAEVGRVIACPGLKRGSYSAMADPHFLV